MSSFISFWREFLAHHKEVGALFATGPTASQALAQAALADTSPSRYILEVGAGDGPVTQILLSHVREGDTLTIVELNHPLIETLQKNLSSAIEDARARGAKVDIICDDILEVTKHLKETTIDHIISTLPFNSLPVTFAQSVMGEYERILKPTGEVTYIEYIGLKRIKRIVVSDPIHDHFFQRLQNMYRTKHEYVWANIPPAHIHTLSFAKTHRPYELHHIWPNQGSLRLNTAVAPYLAVLGTTICTLLILSLTVFKPFSWLTYVLLLLIAGCTALSACLVRFFRDTKVHVTQDPLHILAPADGRIIEIAKTQHPAWGDEPVTRISIFLSIFDQHVIRLPTAGTLGSIQTVGSGHRMAYDLDALHNVGKAIMVTPLGHRPYLLVLLTGFVARRVELFFATGDTCVQGERIGCIHFGSRVDIYLTDDYEISPLQVGEQVSAGRSILAKRISLKLDHSEKLTPISPKQSPPSLKKAKASQTKK